LTRSLCCERLNADSKKRTDPLLARASGLSPYPTYDPFTKGKNKAN
jgi:hypothetical protein